MSDEAIVNASPLILLSRAGYLDLLRAVRQNVLVPEAVLEEVRAKGSGDVSVDAIQLSPWLHAIPTPVVPPSVSVLSLGAGEAAVIASALERSGALAVLDDRVGRRAADTLGIPVVGTAGIVLVAKRRNQIAACRPVLEALVAAGMYISGRTLAALLTRAGE